MHIVKAPHVYTQCPRPWIFLGGVIDMGTARDWQTEIAMALNDEQGTLLNPRRDDWDSSWRQEFSNPKFREQVEWELTAQEYADIRTIVFDVDSKAPISLLELGLNIGHGSNTLVCCAPGFYRKGNVDIVCYRYNVPVFSSLPLLIQELRQFLRKGAHHETE